MANRIAHLSDAHTLDARAARGFGEDLRLRYLSGSRPLDAVARRGKLARALAAATHGGAEHVVISGDLTELGAPGEFEVFAEVLAESRIAPERVTLVPGNHDAYSDSSGWKRALEGPLAPYAEASAGAPGKIVDRGDIAFLPLDTSRHQPVLRSAGQLTANAVSCVEQRLADPALGKRVLVIVQHHPPIAHAGRIMQWFDGLIGHARLAFLLAKHPRVHVLHGHLHSRLDRLIGATRILGAPAVVDDTDQARVRFYDVEDGALKPAA